nr:MAG TPA: HOLLIDAY JUNCTION RESOLVASE [Caudoviricetes sp.]
MTYIGIDPGKDGALAVIIDSGKASIVPFDQDAYRLVLRQFCMQARMAQARAVLEHVGAMPGQGVTSMFSFGENFGYIKGLLEAFEIPYELVRPQRWKKEYGISGKNQSVEVCKRLFPGVSLRRTERCKKDHDGMAEALLMAEFARRHYAG